MIGGIGLIPKTDIYKLNVEISYRFGETWYLGRCRKRNACICI